MTPDWRVKLERARMEREARERVEMLISITRSHYGELCVCGQCCELRGIARGDAR